MIHQYAHAYTPRPHPVPELAEVHTGEDLATGAPQRKCRRMTRSPALPAPSKIDEEPIAVEPDDSTSENASYASLVKTTLSVCSQVHLFD